MHLFVYSLSKAYVYTSLPRYFSSQRSSKEVKKVSQRSRRSRDNLNFPGDRSFVRGYSRRSKSKATRSRFLVRDDPLTNTGYVPTGPWPTFDSTWSKRFDKGRKVVNRVVVRLKFRPTLTRNVSTFVLLFHLYYRSSNNEIHCSSILYFSWKENFVRFNRISSIRLDGFCDRLINSL